MTKNIHTDHAQLAEDFNKDEARLTGMMKHSGG